MSKDSTASSAPHPEAAERGKCKHGVYLHLSCPLCSFPAPAAPRAPAEGEPLSEQARKLIGDLTGAAAFVQSAEGNNEAIHEALREWGTAKSELSRYVAALEQRLSESEQSVVEEIDNRDHYEEQITTIYAALGGEHEWSSEHDLGNDAVGLANALRQRLADAERENKELDEIINTALDVLREPVTLTDARNIEHILAAFVVRREKAKARAALATRPASRE